VLVDRTFNRNNRKKQIERGDAPERIVDVGLSPIYMTLGFSYLRLGMYREAYNAFQYQRQLEPESADPYFNLAVVLMDMNRTDEAAVALVQCLLLEPKRGDVWQALARVYGLYGQQAQGSIIVGADRQPRLNLDNPVVYDHFMKAYRSFITVFRMSNRNALAEGARHAAVYKYRMPAAFFDSLMTDPLPHVTPHGFEWSEPDDAQTAARK
jgi:tetratricopeptide (TPR) repeat protein